MASHDESGVISLSTTSAGVGRRQDGEAPGPADSGPGSREGGQRPFVPFESRWDVRDVAAFLKCSRSWVYKAVEKGWLPCERFGGLLRFDPEVVRGWTPPEPER